MVASRPKSTSEMQEPITRSVHLRYWVCITAFSCSCLFLEPLLANESAFQFEYFSGCQINMADDSEGESASEKVREGEKVRVPAHYQLYCFVSL